MNPSMALQLAGGFPSHSALKSIQAFRSPSLQQVGLLSHHREPRASWQSATQTQAFLLGHLLSKRQGSAKSLQICLGDCQTQVQVATTANWFADRAQHKSGSEVRSLFARVTKPLKGLQRQAVIAPELSPPPSSTHRLGLMGKACRRPSPELRHQAAEELCNTCSTCPRAQRSYGGAHPESALGGTEGVPRASLSGPEAWHFQQTTN